MQGSRACALAVMVALLSGVPAAGAAPPPVIRTGGPSAGADPKLAVVAAGTPVAGRGFTVTDARGKVVLRGTLRRAVGSPKPWRHAGTADLTRLQADGRYRVHALGLTSRPWVVSARARSRLVRRLLRIFAVNSDGNEPNPVFGPAHLNDAIAADGPSKGSRVDLTGGWRDAGDDLKFASTTAYSVIALELAARMDPQDAARLRSASDVGVRWLLKAHPAAGEFYVEVGDERDHTGGFRDPATDDANTVEGVGIRYAYTSSSSDVLAEVAAALAFVAARGPGGEHDALLTAAKDWLAAAEHTSAMVPIRSPFVSNFYPDSDFSDDLALANAALYRATGDTTYAASAGAALRSGSDDQFYAGTNVGSVGPLAAAELCGGLGAPALPDDGARAAGCVGLGKAVSAASDRMRDSAFATPGIVTWGWVQDDGGAGAVAAAAARDGIDAHGLQVAAAARDYLLGRNPWGRSFVVGPAQIEAHNPHHAAYLKGSPSRLLDGAVVGGVADPGSLRSSGLKLAPGPGRRFNSPKVVYEDRRADYVTSEVGLAYSASALLLAASLGADA